MFDINKRRGPKEHQNSYQNDVPSHANHPLDADPKIKIQIPTSSTI